MISPYLTLARFGAWTASSSVDSSFNFDSEFRDQFSEEGSPVVMRHNPVSKMENSPSKEKWIYHDYPKRRELRSLLGHTATLAKARIFIIRSSCSVFGEACDEAHFWLNGYVNKQNCRIWSEANPQVYVETPLHPEKLTVWRALWADEIIGPYFFKNDEGHNVTVNSDRYRAMITDFVIPELNNHDVQELWFQQDGATCHTAHATIDLLKDTFGDRLISRFGP
ncbi:putative DD41D transposase [Trichonephila clavipes]|nr:putative DD41D transposase [Trichonephila clavipes]